MTLRGTLAASLGLASTLALGWLAFPRALYRAIPQPVQFNHKLHSGERVGAKCEDCHALSETGRFSGVPRIDSCSGCHAEPVTKSADEKLLVEQFVKPNRDVPWLVYARQPENVRFSHAIHTRRAKLPCEQCHGAHAKTAFLRPYQENRISGYSRDIWGYNISRIAFEKPSQPSMKMDDCTGCHHSRQVETACLACHK